MAQASNQGQGQQNGSGPTYDDRDILQVCLNEAKHMASSINMFIQEAGDEQLRRDYMTILGDLYSQQKQLFDYMQQKGYYNVKNATAQDIQQAKAKFSSQMGSMQ
ncbi:MAG: Coat domain protein [Firmicutes bacterium]|nr:Coat domain protein [Bacillota bacterium]